MDRRIMAALASGVSALALAPATSLAQQATAADAAPPPAMEEIVVTATRRAERLQEVPVAVTAVTGETIKESGFRTLSDIQYLVPSVQFNSYNGGGFQIRGIGTQSFDYGSDQTVGIMIDGVVQGIPRDPGLNSLTDIDQIEVLRGPQGTLFGKNTSAGVITITTKKPVIGQWEEDAHLSYGSGSETIFQANANVPINEKIAARVSGYIQHRDGIIDNVALNSDVEGTNDMGFRGKVLWQPTDDLDVYFIGSYQRTRDTGNAQTIRSYGPGAANVTGYFVPSGLPLLSPAEQNAPYGVHAGNGNEQVADLSPSGNRYRVHGGSMEATYRLGDYTLTSTTAYRIFDGNQSYISDLIPAPVLDNNFQTEHANQLSQELRLASPTGQFVDYVLGLYYFHTNIDATQIQSGTFGLPNLRQFGFPNGPIYSEVGGQSRYHDDDESYAAFGQATAHLTDQFRFILGSRYTHDEVDSTYRTVAYTGIDPFPGDGLVPPGANSIEHNNVSVHTGLQYDLTDAVMAYATFSTGYKGPTISNIQGEARPILPETSRDYEIGLKSEWFDRRLVLNLAGFYEKYNNFQAQVYDTSVQPAEFTLGNAGGLESKGIEGEFTGHVDENLTLSGGFTYALSTYTDFTSQCYVGQPISPVPGQGCYKDPATGLFAANLAGYPLSAAPRWSYTLNATYRHPVLDGFWIDANTNYVWKSQTYTIVPDPNTIVSSYGLLGINVGLSPDRGPWRVAVFARNLLDQHFVSAIFPNFFDPAGYAQSPAVEARRTVGFTVDFKLGG
jgi:iron complex outermembrane receptor protein